MSDIQLGPGVTTICRTCCRAVPDSRALFRSAGTSVCYDCLSGRTARTLDTTTRRTVAPVQMRTRERRREASPEPEPSVFSSWVFYAFVVAGCALWVAGFVTAIVMLRAVLR